MAKIIADFKADLVAMAREYLTVNWGAPQAHISDDSLIASFLDSLRRRPAPRPREVWEADKFVCPSDHANGWQLLREKVIRGSDLAPHLGRDHSSLKHSDGLLNEWSVHHFHLGTVPHHKDSRYTKRTARVLLAIVTDDDFYAITVTDKHGGWEDVEIIESIHRNWPQAIQRLNGVQGEHLIVSERKQLRKVNGNVATTVSDGTVYIGLGGGVASSVAR